MLLAYEHRAILLLVLWIVLLHCSGIPAVCSMVTEVVGGSGRMGSQFMRLLEDAIAIPRGASPGSVSSLSSGTPIFVCTPASSWSEIYTATLSHRRSDLVFVGNGGLLRSAGINTSCNTSWQQWNVTMVIPHYAILRVGEKPLVSDKAPPTYIAGPHAALTRTLLHRDGVVRTELRTSASDGDWFTIRVAQKLLWTSCLWLLCHSNASSSSPITVSQVHLHRADELQMLVRELWPSFCQRVRESSCQSCKSLSMPTFEDTMQYLEQYSTSISNAIPSVSLAVVELEYRNGVFASPNQTLHMRLVEMVAGPKYLYIFQ
jgi:hypothetical protein